MHQNKLQEGILGSLPILAIAFGESQGIKVTIGGDRAFARGQRINLPAMPTACTDTLRTLAMGYLMHETGHIVETSIPVYGMCDTQLELELLNVIEDVRMEAARIATYPGARKTLADLAEHIDRQGGFGTEEQIRAGQHPAQCIAYWLLTRLRTEALGQNVAQTASIYETQMQALVGDAGMLRLDALLDGVYQLTSTSEALGLARRFVGLLGDLSKEKPPEQPQSQQDEGADDDDQDAITESGQRGESDQSDDSQQDASATAGDDDASGGSDQSDESDHADGSQQDASASGDSDHGTQDGAADDLSGANQGGGDSSQDGDPSSATGTMDVPANSGAGHGDNGQEQPAQSERSNGPNRQALRQALDAQSGDFKPTDIGDIAAEQLSQQATQEVVSEAATTGHGPVFGRTLDVVRPDRGKAPDFDDTMASSAQLRAKLASAMEAQARKRDVLKVSGRRVDGGAAHRLFTDGRIFKRERKVCEVNTAVMVLMDVSGSMATANRIYEARKAALAISAGVHQIHGCKVAAAAFPEIVVLKDFDEQPRPASGRYAINPRGGTPMAEAMIWAATRLATRKEERKMLMVVTDGDPNDAHSVRELIKLYAKSAIEVIGVGIQHPAVTCLFAKNIVVNSLDELPVAMFNLLKGSMRRVA
ncbi:cobaltochelatase CobT-related protein [Metallibacterium scheffleri]|uniref:VWFA domain-containing protein n=1 Tax=Metallibacterium scheffleri TaxID=993689 RepID=A0A4S3KRE3_9GAMM|nr:VWA domain-containing protein [Metallibacterium scheffleri]THD11655.1 hypothetical protein B1806_02665 [Metallibacterium scheffleri]